MTKSTSVLCSDPGELSVLYCFIIQADYFILNTAPYPDLDC